MNEPELYDVLRPVYWRTPMKTPEGENYYRVTWLLAGTARDMAEAKARFGGSPVLRPATH